MKGRWSVQTDADTLSQFIIFFLLPISYITHCSIQYHNSCSCLATSSSHNSIVVSHA